MVSKNLITWSSLCLLFFLVVSFTGCNSNTKQGTEQMTQTNVPIKENDNTLFFVGEKDFAPISFEENGEIIGISPDIIREAFARMGYKVKLQLVPWKRAQEMVQGNEADGFFSPYKSAEREKIYIFPTEPLLIERNVFVVRKDSTIRYDGDIGKLHQYGIGTLIGYNTLDNYIEKNIITNVDRSPNVEASLNKLISGDRKVDLVVNTNYIIWYTAKKLGATDSLQELSPPLAETPSYLAFNQKVDKTEIVAKFEMELKMMKKDGTYNKIIEKYIGTQH